jgi:phosphoenolpyruvate-protein kinase (PTS system EI component)
VGADKPLLFMPQAEERNPYLGVRGIRLSLKSPDMFVTHLRAILRAGAHRDLWLMFPMIATVQETQDALCLLDRAHRELDDAKLPHAWPVKRGAMIEVPSAALVSGHLADYLDFFSIGTNDLTQYTMAAERGNAAVASLQDPLHPAILRLIRFVADGARGKNRHVSVCGDAASDPLGAAVFIGLGVRSLSVRPNQVAGIKAALRGFSLAELETLAKQALQCREALEVRALASKPGIVMSATHQ